MGEIKIKELQKGKKRKVRLELEMDSSLFLTQLDQPVAGSVVVKESNSIEKNKVAETNNIYLQIKINAIKSGALIVDKTS